MTNRLVLNQETYQLMELISVLDLAESEWSTATVLELAKAMRYISDAPREAFTFMFDDEGKKDFLSHFIQASDRTDPSFGMINVDECESHVLLAYNEKSLRNFVLYVLRESVETSRTHATDVEFVRAAMMTAIAWLTSAPLPYLEWAMSKIIKEPMPSAADRDKYLSYYDLYDDGTFDRRAFWRGVEEYKLDALAESADCPALAYDAASDWASLLRGPVPFSRHHFWEIPAMLTSSTNGIASEYAGTRFMGVALSQAAQFFFDPQIPVIANAMSLGRIVSE